MLRFVLTACAVLVSGLLAPAEAADPRSEITGAVTLTPPASLAQADVSEMRGTAGPQLGDAMACLRLNGAASGYIAVFFEDGHVINYRRAVAVDHCEALAYAPLPAPPAPAKKRPPRRSDVPKNAAYATTSAQSAAAGD